MANAPLRSMTGFGEADEAVDAGRLRVQIRTVNHRFLNVQIRAPDGLERVRTATEGALRQRFARGHVSVTIGLDTGVRGEEGAVPVDVARAKGYRDALERLQVELGLGGSVDVALVAGFRDVFQARESRAPELDPDVVVALVGVAADQALAMREEEGARLKEDLSARLDAMEAELQAVERRAPERVVAERDRIRDVIRDLLEDDVAPDEDRIAREVAHLAERWDIHEECVRLRSHLRMFRDTMEAGSPDGVGKRFGFISQEILREVNTIGAKANDALIASHVVTLKEEVERLREQLENVE
jgi:uncharacterized protein (TIGR00255 family)